MSLRKRVWLPWNTARALYEARDIRGVTSDELDRLGFWRSVTGLLAVTLVGLSYGENPYNAVVDNSEAALIVNACLAFFVMLILITLIYFITQRRFRLQLLSGGARFARNIALVICTTVAPVVIINFSFTSERHHKLSLLADFGVVLIVGPIFSWWVMYMFFTFYWAARTVLWIGDIHPLLAPLGASMISILAFGNNFVYGLIYGSQDRQVPVNIELLLALCGIVSTLTLATLEYRYIRNKGVNLASGPLPVGGR